MPSNFLTLRTKNKIETENNMTSTSKGRHVQSFRVAHFRSLSGVSLIELLIGIVILAIVAALLLVGLTDARRSAMRAYTANNLKQLIMMSQAYSVDHKGDIPPYESSEWGGSKSLSYLYIQEYLPQQYGSGKAFDNVFKRKGAKSSFSYARNIALPFAQYGPRDDGLTPRLDKTCKFAKMPFPSRTMLFLETQGNGGLSEGHIARDMVFFDRDDDRGLGGVAFLDGHVEFRNRDNLIGKSPSTPASWNEELRTLWFGFPEATKRQDY